MPEEQDGSSLLRRLGLTRGNVSELSAEFDIKHTPTCRALNVGRGYICICNFFEQISKAALTWTDRPWG